MNPDELPDPFPHTARSSWRAKLIIAVVVFSVFGILVAPAVASFKLRHYMARQLGNGRQIYLSMRNYASESVNGGWFPSGRSSVREQALAKDSNEAFELLLPRYLDDKRPFFNEHSAWCKATAKREAIKNRLLPGENDWVYVRGLTDRSNSQWPLLANAFAPGTTTYVTDRSKPGGVWKGTAGIVIWAGGSAEVVATKPQGNAIYIPRTDAPSTNAFERDATWLAGENVEVLFPRNPDL